MFLKPNDFHDIFSRNASVKSGWATARLSKHKFGRKREKFAGWPLSKELGGKKDS